MRGGVFFQPVVGSSPARTEERHRRGAGGRRTAPSHAPLAGGALSQVPPAHLWCGCVPGSVPPHTRGEGMSGPNLPLQPPLPSLPSPKFALQETTPHPLNNQTSWPPRRSPSCCFCLLTESTQCETLTIGSGPQPKGPLTFPPHPHPTRDSQNSWFHQRPTRDQHASDAHELIRGSPAGCLPWKATPRVARKENAPSAVVVVMSEWLGAQLPAQALHAPGPSRQGSVTGPC